MGHRPPYLAVVTLCVATAQHWRVLRAKLAQGGVTRPLEQITSLHALLDSTEAMVLESMEDKKARDKYFDQMYQPRIDRDAGLAGSGYKPAPAGFEDDEVDASFDAFLGAASGSPR